jgi:hypothetical protein
MNPSSGIPNSSLNSLPYTPCPAVENPANPYDNVGAAHNEALVYILSKKSEWSCGDEVQWIQTNVDLTATFMCDNGYGPSSDCYNANTVMLNNVVNQYQSSTVEDIIADMGSEQLQQYTRQLFDEVRSHTDSTQIDSLLNSIRQLEGEVMASTLNPDEQQTFLGAASIARYSSCYWFQEHHKSVTDWHCPTDPTPAGKFNWGQFLLTVFADVCGGIAGSSLGPAGTIGGAAIVSGAFSAE